MSAVFARPLRPGLLFALCAVGLAAAPVLADSADTGSQSTSVEDLRQAAERARRSAERAQQAADHAERAVDAAEAAATAAPEAATAGSGATSSAPGQPAPEASAAASDPEIQALREQLERAIREAEDAAFAARRAARAVADHEEAHRRRYSRRGLTLSAGAFYAPQFFDANPYTITSTRGLSGALGYRFHERFEVDANFDWLQGFDVHYTDETGDLTAWTTTLNAKLFLLTGSVQPYIGMGLGVIKGDIEMRELSTGAVYRDDEITAVLRFNAGVDLYLSERAALAIDTAMNLPSGRLRDLNYATLGARLKLRF